MKSFFNKDDAEQAYRHSKPYISGILWFPVSIFLYVLDAINQFRIRARKEPFIFLAATAAVIYAIFAYGQLETMNRQLDEMNRQRAITEAQLRPRMSLSFDAPKGPLRDTYSFKKIGGRFVTPIWKNSSSVGPEELVGWVHIRTFAGYTPVGGPDASHLGQENAPLTPLSTESPNTYRQSSEFIDGDNLQRIRARTAQLIGWGYIQYRDPFPSAPVHHISWCYKMVLIQNHGGQMSAAWIPYSPDCNHSD